MDRSSITDDDHIARERRARPLDELVRDRVQWHQVKGKKLKCKKVETVAPSEAGKVTTVAWISSEVPFDGCAKFIVKDKDGKETISGELIDFGKEGGADKPAPEHKEGEMEEGKEKE